MDHADAIILDVKRSDGSIAPERTALSPFFRAFKHPALMHYHRLIAPVVLVNAAVLAGHLADGDWHVADGSALPGLADLVVVNLAVAAWLCAFTVVAAAARAHPQSIVSQEW